MPLNSQVVHGFESYGNSVGIRPQFSPADFFWEPPCHRPHNQWFGHGNDLAIPTGVYMDLSTIYDHWAEERDCIPGQRRD